METSTERSEFKSYVDSYIQKKRNFHVHKKRGNKSMHMNDNTIAVFKAGKRKKDKKLNKEIINLIANVAKNINGFCVKSQFEFEIEEERHTSMWSNHELFKELDEGEIFYYIDIKHCFVTTHQDWLADGSQYFFADIFFAVKLQSCVACGNSTRSDPDYLITLLELGNQCNKVEHALFSDLVFFS